MALYIYLVSTLLNILLIIGFLKIYMVDIGKRGYMVTWKGVSESIA